MYLLVDLAEHMDKMGEIITHLVGTYNVPISIVDNMVKFCPNCNVKAPKPVTVGNRIPQLKHQPQEEKRPLPLDDSPVGRRTAAKNAAIIRALEKPATSCFPGAPTASTSATEDEEDSDSIEIIEPPQLVNVKIEPDNLIPIVPIGIPSPPDQVTSSGIKTPTLEGSAINEHVNVKMEPASMATLHPTLLACLLSSTPNMFAGNGLDTKSMESRSTVSPNHEDEDMPQSPTKLNNFEQIISEMQAEIAIQRRPAGTNDARDRYSSRKSRMVYSQKDLKVLEQYYRSDPNACANSEKKRQMMTILGIDANRLKVWFQNRRRRDKIRHHTESP